METCENIHKKENVLANQSKKSNCWNAPFNTARQLWLISSMLLARLCSGVLSVLYYFTRRRKASKYRIVYPVFWSPC